MVAPINGNQSNSNAYHDSTGSTSTSQSSNSTASTSTSSSSTGSSTSTNSTNSTSTTTSTATNSTSSTSPQTIIYTSSNSSPSPDHLPSGKTNTVSWGTAKGTGSGYDHGSFIGIGTQYSGTKDLTKTPREATDAGKAVSDKAKIDILKSDWKTPSGAALSQDFLKGSDKLANGGTFDHSGNVSALGYNTNASASLGIEKGSLTAKASAGANAYLFDAKAHVGVTDPNLLGGASLTGDAHATAGVGVNGSGKLEANLAKGTLDCSGDVNCFAGVKADASEEAKIGGGVLDEKATGNVGAGLGFDGKFDVGFKDGKLNFSVGASAYVGVGGGGKVSGSIDGQALLKDAAPVASNVEKAASGFLSAASSDVSQQMHNVINWL